MCVLAVVGFEHSDLATRTTVAVAESMPRRHSTKMRRTDAARRVTNRATVSGREAACSSASGRCSEPASDAMRNCV